MRNLVKLIETAPGRWVSSIRGQFRTALLAVEYIHATQPGAQIAFQRFGSGVTTQGTAKELYDVFLPEHLGLQGCVVMRDERKS